MPSIFSLKSVRGCTVLGSLKEIYKNRLVKNLLTGFKPKTYTTTLISILLILNKD
jgi:hypothetical protein